MNIQKYNEVFKEVFSVEDESILQDYRFKESPNWDSVGHMMLCAGLEDAFGIMMDGEDILNITSYEEGKKILAKYGVEF